MPELERRGRGAAGEGGAGGAGEGGEGGAGGAGTGGEGGAGGAGGPGAEPRRRLFFALWADEACRARLEQAAAGLRAALPGRWLDPQDWHVTLCFLGAVPERLLAPLREQAERIEARAFSLRLERAAYWREARLLAALAAAPPAALQLAAALRGLARSLGLAPDDKPLRPHVTLARGVPLALWQRAAGRAARRGLRLRVSLPATEFHLAESRALPSGEPLADRQATSGAGSTAVATGSAPRALRYVSLARWPLRA
ncbi:MAG TPA: RNA 2',3'-cyclic phosphodiesterase [Steroidobacteraceae bacterium]|nr:RNA 2',3'-cyclic phosphodiesterase [Steroidobacteraceae bacterium]